MSFFNISYAIETINYLAGIGEFEIGLPYNNITPLEEIFLKGRNNDFNLLPFGWSITGLPSIKNFKFRIDRNNSVESNGSSFYLEINSTTEKLNNFSLYSSIWLSKDRIATITRDYYPKDGDFLDIRLTYRVDEAQNVNIYLRPYVRWILDNNNITSTMLTSSPLILNQQQNFIDTEIITRIPLRSEISNQIKDMERIVIYIYFNFPNNDNTKKLKLWLDKIDVYALRNNEYLTLPSERRESSLNFAEIFVYGPDWGLKPGYDFIKLYLDNIKITNSFRDIYLINKKLDSSFKHTFYISPTTFHRYKKYNTTTDNEKYVSRVGLSEPTTIFDDIQIATNTDVPYASRNHPAYRVHPNARYPEYLSLRTNMPNYYNYPYMGTKYMIGVTHHKPYFIDLVNKYFYNLDYYIFEKSSLAPYFYFIDNYNARSYTSSPEIEFRELNMYNYFKNVDKNLYPLRNYFINLGYTGLSPLSPLKKFGLKGYMNEGWLYNPEYFTYPNTSTAIYNLFASVVENKDLDAIFLVAGYPHYSVGGNPNSATPTCSDNHPIVRSIVSSFYLVNNNNVYVALVPSGYSDIYGEGDKYGPPQCYPQSMFVEIGDPEEINSINSMIIGTTSDNWYVYERRYTKGKVIFNSSASSTYSYSINWANEPFQRYREYFSDYIYTNSSSSPIDIPPKSGIILYNDEKIDLLSILNH